MELYDCLEVEICWKHDITASIKAFNATNLSSSYTDSHYIVDW